MSYNKNIVKSKSECELIMIPNGNYLRVECDPGSLRVTDAASYIKLNVLASDRCLAYKVTIKVETLTQSELLLQEEKEK